MKKINIWYIELPNTDSFSEEMKYLFTDIDGINWKGELKEYSDLKKDEINFIASRSLIKNKIQSCIDHPLVQKFSDRSVILYGLGWDFTDLKENCHFLSEDVINEILFKESSIIHSQIKSSDNIVSYMVHKSYYCNKNGKIINRSLEEGFYNSDFKTLRKYKASIHLGVIENRHSRQLFKSLLLQNGLPENISISWFPDNLLEKEDIPEIRKDRRLILQPPKQMIDSYLNIAFESRPEYINITEKTIKPILCKTPFIWFSGPKTTEWLQDNGFMLYKGIDYSFDKIVDNDDRVKSVYQEFKRLYPILCEDFIKENKKILDHNYNNFFETYEENKSNLYKDLLVSYKKVLYEND